MPRLAPGAGVGHRAPNQSPTPLARPAAHRGPIAGIQGPAASDGPLLGERSGQQRNLAPMPTRLLSSTAALLRVRCQAGCRRDVTRAHSGAWRTAASWSTSARCTMAARSLNRVNRSRARARQGRRRPHPEGASGAQLLLPEVDERPLRTPRFEPVPGRQNTALPQLNNCR